MTDHNIEPEESDVAEETAMAGEAGVAEEADEQSKHRQILAKSAGMALAGLAVGVGFSAGWFGAEGYEAVSGEELHIMEKTSYGTLGGLATAAVSGVISIELLLRGKKNEEETSL